MIVCNKCGIEKPDKDFYFVSGKKAQKGKRRNQCKMCFSTYQKENSIKHITASHKHQLLHPYRVWASSVLSAHKKRGFEINITLTQLEKIAVETTQCPICGKNLDYSRLTKNGKNIYNSPSIDRINNGKILNKNNIWIICKECNTTKGSKTMKEFIDYCKMVGDKFGV